jgi:hypothetical protein
VVINKVTRAVLNTTEKTFESAIKIIHFAQDILNELMPIEDINNDDIEDIDDNEDDIEYTNYVEDVNNN